MKRRFLLMAILLAGAIYAVYAFEFTKKGEAYSGIAGNILAATFAAFLAWVAWVEWGKVSKTSSADFIHKLTNDFFTTNTKTILGLIECNALEFVDQTDGQAYFQVNEVVLEDCRLPNELLRRLQK